MSSSDDQEEVVRSSKRRTRRVVHEDSDEDAGAEQVLSSSSGMPAPSPPAAAGADDDAEMVDESHHLAAASNSPDASPQPKRSRLRRAAAAKSPPPVAPVASSIFSAPAAAPAAAASSSSGRSTRASRRRRAQEEDDEWEESKSDAEVEHKAAVREEVEEEDEAYEDEEEAQPQPRSRRRAAQRRRLSSFSSASSLSSSDGGGGGDDSRPSSPRYELRASGLRGGQRMSESTQSAMERLLAERKKAARKEGAESPPPEAKRRRLHRAGEDAPSAASSSSSAAAAAAASSAAPDKFARVEAIILKDADEEEEDGEDESLLSHDPKLAKWKASYDPLREAAELEQAQKQAERRKQAEAEREAQRREEEFAKFKKREEKKKRERTGKGVNAPKPEGAGRGGGRKRRKNEDEDDYFDDDDDFVVPDEYVEESGEEVVYARFDEREFERSAPRLLETAMTPRDAFDHWCRYLMGATIDAGFTGVIDRDPLLRAKYDLAHKIVEEQFNMRMSRWVRSQTWDREIASDVRARMDSLAYTISNAAVSVQGCEVCLPRKGHAHQAAFQLSYYGVAYDPDQLKHPFRPDRILKGNTYDQHSFWVGQLCHQRLKLYHVMRHFKLHVMLSLKSRLKRACKRYYSSDETPPSKQAAFRIIDLLFKYDSESIEKQWKIWETLNSLADAYSSADSRKVYIDTQELDHMHNFDAEECILELFDWRSVGAADKFDLSSHILEAEQAFDEKQAEQSEKERKQAEEEYEIDPEAEEEAANAEQKMKKNRKRRRKQRGESEEEQDDDILLIEDAKAAAKAQEKRNGSAAAAAARPSSSSPPVDSGQQTLGGWVHRRTSTSAALSRNLPPPSSAESIQDADADSHADDASVQLVEEKSGQPDQPAMSVSTQATTQPMAATGGWRSRKNPTLPLSVACSASPADALSPQQHGHGQQHTSPPRSSPASSSSTGSGRSPPVSAGKLQLSLGGGSRSHSTTSPPGAPVVRDGESLASHYAGLSHDEQLNFLAALAPNLSASHVLAQLQRTSADVRRRIVEWADDIRDTL